MNDRWAWLFDATQRRNRFAALEGAPLWPRLGRVQRVQGPLIEAIGLRVVVGEECEIEGQGAQRAEVVGFRDMSTLLMPVGHSRGLFPGALVRPLARMPMACTGDALCGRVLDALGEPMDGKGAIEHCCERPLHCRPPSPTERKPITQPLPLGVRVLDACLPIGQGQRIGLFAGAGVGKTTLLGMIARHAKSPRIVIALIGERGREVRAFLDALGEQALSRTVVVVATADQPPLVKVRAAHLATAIAEGFRERGEHVLLLVDSLTRLLQAQREIGLLLGEPPTTKGYTPSSFSLLSEIVERAGTSSKGSISAIYTVLVEGDDLRADPVADAAMAVLDGHVVLARRLAERGWFPAVDLLASVSRLTMQLIGQEQRRALEVLRRALAAYEEVADMIALGVYRSGSDPLVDRMIEHRQKVEEFFRQEPDQCASPEESARRLHELAHLLGTGGA